jgi:hypothetical protein
VKINGLLLVNVFNQLPFYTSTPSKIIPDFFVVPSSRIWAIDAAIWPRHAYICDPVCSVSTPLDLGSNPILKILQEK